MSTPDIKGFFARETSTISYVVADRNTKACAVIDSVLDFNYASGTVSYKHADQIINHIARNNLQVKWLIETHVHADHLSAAPYIKQQLGGEIAISREIVLVQDIFGKVFNLGREFRRDGSQFDRLLCDGDTYKIGTLTGKALHTPGHTPACMTHVIGNAVFVGDTLFMPDGGTARTDFPGGSARSLYHSIQKIFSLPGDLRVFVCHDYSPNGREVLWETTIAEEQALNIHIGGGKTEQEFILMRTERDAGLGMPKLIMPSIQVNMRAGNMPPAEKNGGVYLKVPVNGLKT